MADKNPQTQAGEHLRLVLPLMSKHQIPATPENYAVWYEHVAGTNTELRTAINQQLLGEGEITEELTRQLYKDHVVSANERRLEEARDGLVEMLREAACYFGQANQDVDEYRTSLGEVTAELSEQLDGHQLQAIVHGLAEKTQAVETAAGELQSHLEQSRTEAERLRTELKLARKEALTDTLTGLVNRRCFDEGLHALTEKTEQAPLCLLLLDIDRFKAINDSYGHLLGDKVIRYLGRMLSDTVKGQDLAARYGGEEFAVLLPDTPYDGAVKLAERLREKLAQSRLVKAETQEPIGQVTISIGVALFGTNETPAQFVDRADQALYQAKREGRNRVVGERDLVRAQGS